MQRRQGRTRTDEQNDVDRHVGLRMRERRVLLGLSQEALGRSAGLSFQQIQKYESGANRIGASLLYEFSRQLGVPVTYFFDGIEDLSGAGSEANANKTPRNVSRETLELARAYYRIGDEKVRQSLLDLIRITGPADGNP